MSTFERRRTLFGGGGVDKENLPFATPDKFPSPGLPSQEPPDILRNLYKHFEDQSKLFENTSQRLYNDLPSICRHLFGSESAGMGYLDVADTSEKRVLLELMDPESPFVQSIIKANNERYYYELNFNVLPESVQRKIESKDTSSLPAVFRERLVEENGGLRMRVSILEYYLYYFVYFATMEWGQQGASGFRKASSLTALGAGLQSVAVPLSPLSRDSLMHHHQSYLRSSSSSAGGGFLYSLINSRPKRVTQRKPFGSDTVYVMLLNRYLAYFTPVDKFGFTLHQLQRNIITCSNVPHKRTQLAIAMYFVQIMCEVWLLEFHDDENVVYCMSKMEEYFLNIEVLLKLNMKIHAEQLVINDTALWNMPEFLNHFYYVQLRNAFPQACFLLIENKPTRISFGKLVEVIWGFMAPVKQVPSTQEDNERFQKLKYAFIIDNLPVYSRFLQQLLGYYADYSPVNSIIGQLSSKNTSLNISAGFLNDMTLFDDLLSFVYTPDVVALIRICEQLITKRQMLNAPQANVWEDLLREYEPKLAMINPSEYEAVLLEWRTKENVEKVYMNVLYLEVSLQKVQQKVVQEGENSSGLFGRLVKLGSSSSELSLETLKKQWEAVSQFRQTLDKIFLDEPELKNKWRSDAVSYIDDALTAEKEDIYVHAEKLSRKNKQLIMSGQLKCSKLDIKPKRDLSDWRVVYSNEIAFLVYYTVMLGYFLNRKWRVVLDTVRLSSGFNVPDSLYTFRWERVTRQFASINNLTSCTVMALVAWLVMVMFW